MLAKKLKHKNCKACKKLFLPYRPLQAVCSPNCAITHAKALEEKKQEKEWQIRKKEGLEAIKTLGEYEIEAKTVFQKFVRFRDVDCPCISCGCTIAKWDGGHYFKSELYSGLIFHEDNCHKQCSRCNRELHGNESNYRIGLVNRIGEERVKWLEENKDRLRTYKYSKKELIAIKLKYKLKLKEL